MKRTVLTLAIFYLILLGCGAAVIHSSLNVHWLATLFLFSPRWVAALPLLLLVPLTIWIRPRISWIYLIHAAILAFLILGFKIGGRGFIVGESLEPIRVLTCNLGGGQVDLDKLQNLIEEKRIQLVFFQECSVKTSQLLFDSLQWNSVSKGNIAIGSIHELGELEVLARYPKKHYSVTASIGCDVTRQGESSFRVASLHLPTFRPAFEKLRRFDFEHGPIAMSEMGDLYQSIARPTQESVEGNRSVDLIAGDFNVPVESVYYRDFWGTMINAFSEVGSGLGHTKFTRWHGIRIDHILTQPTWKPVMAEVGPDLGGDHRPVIAELVKVSQ